MNAEVKKKWVNALRSGDYHQGRGRLRKRRNPESTKDRNLDLFCCLGVLCDLYDPEGWEGDLYLGASVFPPLEVEKWAGLSVDGSYGEPNRVNVCVDLVTMNDGENPDEYAFDFEEIADYIEREL